MTGQSRVNIELLCYSCQGGGVTFRRGVVWLRVTTRGLALREPPPSRPFDSSQSERPLLGMDSGSGAGMTEGAGGKERRDGASPRSLAGPRDDMANGGGGRWARRISSAGPPPARPFDSAQGERSLPGMDSRLGARQRRTFSIFDRLSGAGMTGGWGRWGEGGHETRPYGGRRKARKGAGGQVLYPSRGLGMTGCERRVQQVERVGAVGYGIGAGGNLEHTGGTF